MDEKMKRQLEEAGIDVDGTMERFLNNEDLFLKFLKAFPADENFGELVENLEKRKYKEAFENAHTLKGVSGNLGLTCIYKPVSEITELLRNQSPELLQQSSGKLEEELGIVKENYQRVLDVIGQIG